MWARGLECLQRGEVCAKEVTLCTIQELGTIGQRKRIKLAQFEGATRG